MLSRYVEILHDVFEVFSDACNLFYQGITTFVHLICNMEQLVPLSALLIPARIILFGRVDVSLELVGTLLAVDFAIIWAGLDAALVLLDLASATARRHLHNLSLIAYHNI